MGGGALISRPDLWPVNVEIDFGDGLYGKRCSGTITRAANAENFVLITYHNCGTVFASGGMYATIDNNYYIHIGQPFVNGEIGTIYRDQAKDLYFMSRIPFNRTNAPYDVWALYTKA